MKASPETIMALAGRTATKIQSFNPEHGDVQNIIGNSDHPYWKAIESVFVEQSTPQVVTSPVPVFEFPRTFKAKQTNLDEIIPVTERFAKKFLGVTANLREMFDFPAELPWKDVLLAFDPGLDNHQVVEKALKSQRLSVYEESNVMEYKRSEAFSQPTLQIIENSIRPTEGTYGQSSNQLNADGKPYLELRGYALAFGLRYFAFKDYLDLETWTWFPKNRLPGGGVASGRWSPYPGFREVRFYWLKHAHSHSLMAARLAMSVKPKA
ncbi:MAG: hypothetical protein AAB470_01820 [Patescibacteria group bacterium]